MNTRIRKHDHDAIKAQIVALLETDGALSFTVISSKLNISMRRLGAYVTILEEEKKVIRFKKGGGPRARHFCRIYATEEFTSGLSTFRGHEILEGFRQALLEQRKAA